MVYDPGEESRAYPPSDPAWAKWTPRAPTSPHWYTPAQFQALLGALLHADRQTVPGARFLSTALELFDGFSGSAARRDVLGSLGLTRATLEALAHDNDIDPRLSSALLKAMQDRARPVVPKRLGVLGESHLLDALSLRHMVDPATFVYRAQKGMTEGLPYVLEVACGQARDPEAMRELLCGFNFTPALGVPFWALYDACGTADVNEDDPVTLLVHVTCPYLPATDKGKTAVTLPDDVDAALRTLVGKVAEPWTKLKTKARREGKQRTLQAERERRAHRPMQVKTAAWQVMEAAYLKASNGGRLPANARQIMYAARPWVIERTGKAQPWKHSSYFTQTLLPDFMEAHPELTATWDVVFDARGHFREPHTAYEFGLGTVEVRQYISGWTTQLAARRDAPTLDHTLPTWGPAFRYEYALFIEKEGFDALLDRARLQDRYDVALMSTKGMTVTAARALVESLSQAGVTILVVHDFDKSGLEILHKFTANTRRYRYTVTPTVIDLGLRLEEALAMGLESEPVPYDTEVDPRINLRECGATEAECAFLVTERQTDFRKGKVRVHWIGERIELNAMDSQQFLDWLEQKLQDAGVAKVVPEAVVLAMAYRRQRQTAKLQQILDAAMAEPDEDAPVPDDLAEQVRARIQDTAQSWDGGLWDIVRERLDGEDERDDA